MTLRKQRIAELEILIAEQEISEENGATPQLDDNGKVIEDIATCGTCGKSWNDALITQRTPAPSARCPYEYIHAEIAELTTLKKRSHKAGRSKVAKARKALTRDQLFFYEHADYSYDPKTETAEQGRIRGAIALAKAEEHARNTAWEFDWVYDEDGCIGCDCDNEECACSSGADHETLCCILRTSEPSCYDGHGNSVGGAVLASLGGICGADSNYRRVVEAELALEAL